VPADETPTLLHVLRGGNELPAVYGAARRLRRSRLPVVVEPRDGAPPAVRYRWDEDTEILVAHLGGGHGRGAAPGAPSSSRGTTARG
jgi:hypothetical protein